MTELGVRIAGISVDSPRQHAAMVENLRLPFPLLSDPQRDRVIEPYGLSDEHDPRHIARPAVVVIAPDGEEVWRSVARDFAERVPEDRLLEVLRELDLPPTEPEPLEIGPAEPGPKAMPFEQLYPYFRGARFAVVAMSRRHPELAEDAKAYIEEMDRYMENVRSLYKEKQAAP